MEEEFREHGEGMIVGHAQAVIGRLADHVQRDQQQAGKAAQGVDGKIA